MGADDLAKPGESPHTRLQRFGITTHGWNENLRANRRPKRRGASTGAMARDPAPDVELS